MRTISSIISSKLCISIVVEVYSAGWGEQMLNNMPRPTGGVSPNILIAFAIGPLEGMDSGT
jgi:hypothetical protein